MAGKRGPSIQKELLLKSREAALNAVQTFNNPLTTFKAETFIVLITIAWTGFAPKVSVDAKPRGLMQKSILN